MHLWSFMCHPIFPWNAGSSDIGYNIVFVWCSLSFDTSIRAEVSTLRKVVMTGHKQPLMGRPGEWVLHTNIRIVNLSQSFGTDFFWPNPTIKSTHQVIQPSLQQVCLVTDSPSPWTTKKKLRLKEPIKKETIRCASLQIGFDVFPLVGR